MSTVNAATMGQSSGMAGAIAGRNALGKDDFLKLLVAQLQHQDPLKPADPTEFTAQLAQFSSLEQLFSVNATLEKLAASQNMASLSLLGREVMVENASFTLGEGKVQLGYRLDAPAEEVTLFIRDSFGRTVAMLDGKQLGAGEHFLTWDGSDSLGQVAPKGEYSVLVSAVRGQDEAVAATSLIKGTVTGVELNGSRSRIVTTAGTFGMEQLKSVRSL